jgi:hypothetical protein
MKSFACKFITGFIGENAMKVWYYPLSSARFVHESSHTTITKDMWKWAHRKHFHSVTSHGIIFWRNSTDNRIVFNMQNKMVQLMKGNKVKHLVMVYLKNLFPFPLNLYSEPNHHCLLLQVTWQTFQKFINTRTDTIHKCDLYMPSSNPNSSKKVFMCRNWVIWCDALLFNI